MYCVFEVELKSQLTVAKFPCLPFCPDTVALKRGVEETQLPITVAAAKRSRIDGIDDATDDLDDLRVSSSSSIASLTLHFTTAVLLILTRLTLK